MKNESGDHDGTILAGEYVLGTLQGEDRIAFERRLLEDSRLQREADAWERRLAPLLETIEPVTPPASLWRRLEMRTRPATEAYTAPGPWDSLRFWRALGMVAATLVLGLTITLLSVLQQGRGMDGMMVVLNDRSGTGWIVAAQRQGGYFKVKAVQPSDMPQGKVCLLWMKDEHGNLFPVGVLPQHGSMKMPMPAAPGPGNRFMVSIEEQEKLPTAKPSAEIVFEGRLTEI